MKNKIFSFRLDYYDGHKLKDGSYPVMLVIRKDNRRKTINLGISARIFDNGSPRWIEVNRGGKKEKIWNPEIKSQWNIEFQRFEIDKRRKDLHPDRDKLNKWLDKLWMRCDDVIKEFEDKRIDWTLNQFEESLFNKSKKGGIEAYFLNHIEKLDKIKKIGNKLCYEQTLNMLRQFDKSFSNRVFGEIDLKYVERFCDYLDNRGQCGNTKKYYIKTLRSILNKAIRDKECPANSYPFGKDGFSIAALTEETKKRYLPNDYLDKLKSPQTGHPKLEWARNLFLFSYYCQGMSIVDVAHLTSKNIIVGEDCRYIEYKRQKTEGRNSKFLHIKITENIQSILDWAKSSGLLVDDYLMPVVSIKPKDVPVARKVNKLNKHKAPYLMTPEHQLHEHIRNRLKKYNKALKDLGTELEFEVIISSYMSRHSYAMRLKNCGISEDIISEALGHKDMLTTKIYLDSFQNKEVEKANEVL